MNLHDTTALILLLAQVDPKQVPAEAADREIKISAWESLLDPAITFPWARDQVLAHYRVSGEQLLPAALNESWRAEHSAVQRAATYDSEFHCGRSACDCSHTNGCVKGWMDADDGLARPCGRCRPWLSRRLAQAPPPARRTDADGYRLRGEGVDRESIDWSPHVRG